MNHASRGVVLAIAAVVLGLIILGQGFDGGDIDVDTTASSDSSVDGQTVLGSDDSDDNADGSTETPTADPTTDDGGETDASATDADSTDGATTDGTADEATDGQTTDDSGSTDTGATLKPPENTRVLVLNDTTTAGLAGTISQTLQASDGYNSSATNSTTQGSGAASAVYFAEGYRANAIDIAKTLGLTNASVAPMPASPPVEDLNNANVLVFVGVDLIAS